MGKNSPLVSIVLLNWNGLEDTKECLRYIKKQTYNNCETIVVDNGSTDGSVGYLRTLKDIKLVISKTNEGFTGGHINGLKHASGEYILILNNDAVMKPNLIEQALVHFKDNSVAAVGGRAYFWNNDNPILNEDNDFYSYQFINPVSAEAIFYQKDYGLAEEVNNISGSCALIRKSVIDELGYLDNRFFAYYEEADFFARCKRDGYKVIYDPFVRIWHKIGASSQKKSSSFMYYMLFRNRFIFAVHNFEPRFVKQFLYSYTKFGIKSILKILLKRGDQDINKPFARAFLHNLFTFIPSFTKRHSLEKLLGKSRYNSQIIAEELTVSHILSVNTRQEAISAIKLSKKIHPSHELIIVASADYQDILASICPSNVRLVTDKQYFDTHTENIGAIVSRYDWIVLTNLEALASEDYTNYVDTSATCLYVSEKSCYINSSNFDSNNKLTSSLLLNSTLSLPVILERSVFLKSHGLSKEYSFDQSLSIIAAYCHNMGLTYVSKELRPVTTTSAYSALSDKDLEATLSLIDDMVRSRSKKSKPRFYDGLFGRFYRLQQLRFLISWLTSSSISLRLKLARIKNLLKWSFALKKSRLVQEMKHIRNESLLASGAILNLEHQKSLALKSFNKLSVHPENTTVFIICRDRLSPLLQLVEWLESAGLKKIVFIDNGSVYPELVSYFSKTNYQFLDMKRNIGHTVPWQQSIIPILVPEDYYIVTDPDVIPTSKDGLATIASMYKIHKRFPEYLKVGLGLKIDDLPNKYTLKNSVIEWESQFWKNQVANNVYDAGVDTTFALYKPFVYKYIIHPSLRLGEPLTARHLPWYTDSSKLTKEDIFYRLHANQEVNSWDADSLPERYKKELAKQQ